METREQIFYDTARASFDIPEEKWKEILEQKPPAEYGTVMGERDPDGIYNFEKRAEIMERLSRLEGVQKEIIGSINKPTGKQAEQLLSAIKRHLESQSGAWIVQGHGAEYTSEVFKKLLTQDTENRYLPEKYDVPIFRIKGNGNEDDPVLFLVGGVDGNERASTPAALWFIKRCAAGGDMDFIRGSFKEIAVIPMYAPYSVDMGIRMSIDYRYSSPTFKNPTFSADVLLKTLKGVSAPDRENILDHRAKLSGMPLSKEEVKAIALKIGGEEFVPVSDERVSEVLAKCAIGPTPEEKIFRDMIAKESSNIVIVQLHEKNKDGQTTLLLSDKPEDDLLPLRIGFADALKKAGFTPGANPLYFKGTPLGDGVIHDFHTSGDIGMRYNLDITVEAGTPNMEAGETEDFASRVGEFHAAMIGVFDGVRRLSQNKQL